MNANRHDFIETVEQRLKAVFLEYNKGCDVPPARVFRLEGYIEAGRDVGLISQQQACDLIRSAWREVLRCELPVCAENTIQIPAAMQRAPVYPSK
ncbi:MAG: hypothetical protein V7459_10835 [Oceanicoccus sp.]